MILTAINVLILVLRLSRTSGGDPQRLHPARTYLLVFPARAGVILASKSAYVSAIGLSRTSGGDPEVVNKYDNQS